MLLVPTFTTTNLEDIWHPFCAVMFIFLKN
jgi:hypothetical protein